MKKSNDGIKIIGRVHVKHIRNGKIIFEKDLGKNLVTSVGKAAIAALVGNTGSVPAFTYLALGTSSTAAAIGDTALGAEITDTGLTRTSAAISRTTTTVTNDTLNLVVTFTSTGAKTVQEIGILNNTLASGTSILLARKLTGAITVANTDQIVATYTVQFT